MFCILLNKISDGMKIALVAGFFLLLAACGTDRYVTLDPCLLLFCIYKAASQHMKS